MANPNIRDPGVIAAISEELEGEDRPTHPLGGPEHTPSTLAELNAKISDADLSAAAVPTLHETIGAQTIIAKTYATSAAATGEDSLVVLRGAVRAYDPATGDHALWEFLVAVKRLTGVLTVLSVQFTNGPTKFGSCIPLDVTFTINGEDIRLNVVGTVGVDARWSVLAETPVLIRDLDFP